MQTVNQSHFFGPYCEYRAWAIIDKGGGGTRSVSYSTDLERIYPMHYRI